MATTSTPPVDPAPAFSHLVISSASASTFQLLFHFYHDIAGFKPLSGAIDGVAATAAPPSASIYLQTYQPAVGTSSPVDGSGGVDVTLQLCFIPDESAAAAAGVNLEKLLATDNRPRWWQWAEFEAASKVAILDAKSFTTSASAAVALRCSDGRLASIRAQLEEITYPYASVKVPSVACGTAVPCLLVADPAGNAVLFSSHNMGPFKTAPVLASVLADSSAAATVNKIIAQVDIGGGDAYSALDSMTDLSQLINLHEPHKLAALAAAKSSSSSSASASGRKRKIAILTSGGDSPGMNAALRAIVRVSLVKGCLPYAVWEGYQGLVEGGDKLRRMYWDDVQGVLNFGGTIIGTARCKEFRTREGRLKAAENLAKNGIDSLIVIGGDGSLTGADIMRSEWPGLIKELLDAGRISASEAKLSDFLTIVGMVGSIDNDMSLTDMTIGAVTSLHRICEAVDNISSTATSHQRAFVIEVMGRNCGWLALMAGIATGADYLFIPEDPPEPNWEDRMCKTIRQHREMGKRKSIIIISEGALDRDLKPIKAEYIRDMITKKLNVDTRVTTLGHIQRGGAPAAFDRYLGTIQGVEAVDSVLCATPDTEPPMIGFVDNKVTATPLMAAVKETLAVAEAIQKKDFTKAIELRGSDFRANLEAFNCTLRSDTSLLSEAKRLRIAIVHTGAPAGGMNAATRAAARYAISHGHTPLAVNNGFAGLIAGDIRPLSWMDVESWTVEGGSKIGTNRSQPTDDLGLCAYQIQKHSINAVMIIGGFEAYTAIIELTKARSMYPAMCIPLILLPATLSNNVPGTQTSLGADTALNVVIEACDRIRQSAYSSRKRVFVVEVQGGQCGFLATLSALCAGATCSYIPEEGLNLKRISTDCSHLVRMFSNGAYQGRVIIRNENVSATYTTDVVSSIFREEGRGVFDSRSAILGHIQQGGIPSPFDRVNATRLAVKAVQWIEEQAFASMAQFKAGTISSLPEDSLKVSAVGADNLGSLSVAAITAAAINNSTESATVRLNSTASGVYTAAPESSVVIGIAGSVTIQTPVESLIDQTNFKERRPKSAWWLPLNNLVRVLAKYGYSADT